LLQAAAVWAQDDLVRVSIRPDNEAWDWRPYAEKLARRMAEAIDSRVNEGFPRREFTLDSLATAIEFRFRIDTQGRLRHFAPLRPRHRYLAYLIRRTARELAPFDPLPEEFPLFYFDGTISFKCRMKPTGRYKRLYFEEPLDAPEETAVTPFYKQQLSTPLIFYEPQILDKKQLLEEFKKRIGAVEEIADTSSYTPLDFTSRNVAVKVAYDSLTGSAFESEMLKIRIEAALVEAGARLTELENVPAPKPAIETPPRTEADSALVAEPPDTSAKDSLGSAPEEKPAVQLPVRDLAAAFTSSLGEKKTVLVFSAGVLADTVPNKAICRVRLFPWDNPGNLKRRVDYTFEHSGILPDSLGRMIVARLTDPPPRPKPPAKPKPKPKAAPVKAENDSAAVDPKAAAKTPGPKPKAVQAKAESDSAAVDTKTAVKADGADGSASSPADTTAPAKAVEQDTAKQPQAAPKAPAPADTGSTSGDTTGQAAPPTSQPSPEAVSDSAQAAQDTTAGTPGGSP